ncbi:hypothetical protein MHPYR_80116 [uncultured Mycobacterium sp.]|uniref:Uncharacterized protein n=1 Tax=uncultured Mycobacterium sp. TaxID=171292 RepID=A0A1Y5PLA1_9MYCO|nr:hypothetical protein MHPYR_80116 [uncultured Mycobacterium sp.]
MLPPLPAADAADGVDFLVPWTFVAAVFFPSLVEATRLDVPTPRPAGVAAALLAGLITRAEAEAGAELLQIWPAKQTGNFGTLGTRRNRSPGLTVLAKPFQA